MTFLQLISDIKYVLQYYNLSIDFTASLSPCRLWIDFRFKDSIILCIHGLPDFVPRFGTNAPTHLLEIIYLLCKMRAFAWI